MQQTTAYLLQHFLIKCFEFNRCSFLQPASICCILVPPFFFIRLLVFCSTYHPTSRLLCLCCLQLEPPLQQQHDALLQVLPLKDQKISPGQCRIFFKTVLLPSCVKLQHQILTFPCSIWSFNHTVHFCPDCLVF